MALAPASARAEALVYNGAIMFNPSREEVRRFFCDAWQKQLTGGVLTPLEAIAVDWIREHPEYHALLTDTEGALAQDYTPEQGQTNPFLHLSMHLSISEQVSIDQPPGIRQAYEALTQRLDSPHEAQHQIMECLGEMLWQAQRSGLPPDGAQYVDAVRRRASR
ncbi:hypothetical protein LMG23994_05391 [Cupriavidus pinatubonensis]|uniref:DUF1841 domain-containing protein n=3 Tax=Burkholderiaceae TaxID=119060 RepID=Q473L1_CUPPJ|nr:hypothetical protein LMG23994_05391 [Cupriavidus pinatubonensis]